MRLRHARGMLESERCLIMGVVNRTPDSFYDGGRMGLEQSVDFALALIEQGADVLDLGGVKAGPGEPVDSDEEARRLVPLVEAVADRSTVPLSIETGRSTVARRAFEAGAAILNDVSGLADEGLAEVCATCGGALVLMHNGGQIRGRPRHPRYADVVADVIAEWARLARRARAAGVAKDALLFDPGLDFGKTTFHSLEIMRRLGELIEPDRPVLVAASRKDVVGETLDLPLEERLEGSLALAVLAAHAGAAVVRVHDVAASRRAIRMTNAVSGVGKPSAPVRGLWD